MKGTARARMEQKLAVAHRQIWLAREAAEDLGSPGDFEDLTQILNEITRVAEASLKGQRRQPTPGQTALVV